jgi:hypothetical protein
MSRPLPNPSQRHHAHSISLGASNSNHRVTRRKSVTTAAAHAAAAIASMEGGESTSLPMGAHRRSLAGRKGQESGSVGNISGFSSYLSRSINSPSQEPPVARKGSPGSDHSDSKLKNRNRRASEGALLKTEGKRASTAIRCDRCGKGYKHGSCLSKHMCVSPLPLGRLPLRSGICTTSALCRSPSWSFNSPFFTVPLFSTPCLSS